MTGTQRPLSGRIALVTGASRGIAKGIATELGAAGATVYVTARTFDQTEDLPGSATQTADEVTAAGGKGIPLRCDHADDSQVRSAVETIRQEHGGLDILVNCVYSTPGMAAAAGPEMPGGKPFWESSPDSWETAFTVGVRGHFVTTQACVPLLLERSGLVINIASPGVDVYFHSVLYGVGKAANDRLMRDMAFELRDTDVTCLSIWPGWVATETTDEWFAGGYEPLRHFQQLILANFAEHETEIAKLTDADLAGLFETPQFTGRAVAALAADSNVSKRHGKAFAAVGLADEYGFTDTNGRRPDGCRYREIQYWPSLT